MAGEDLIVPAPPLGPDDLGLSMPPQAPQAPIQSAPQDDFKSKLMKLLAIGVAGGMGPGMGTGVLQGMAHADQQKEQTRLRNDQIARQTYQQQQGDYEQQQRIYAQEAQRRQQAIMQSRDSLMKIAPTLKTKAEYDKYVEAYASGLQSMGLRISPNWFRQAVPYNAQDVGERAAKTLDGYMKNQVNADNLKNHPESLKTATVWFDRMGEGTKQKILLTDLAILADQPFGEGPDGIIVYPKGTTAETKASAEGILQDLLDKDLAEGTVQTPQRRIELKQQAIKIAKEAADLPNQADPTLTAIRELQLSNLQSAPKASLTPQQQRRVDALAKGFDTQPAVRNAQTMAEAVSFAQSLDPNTTNPADDQGLIYAFAKAMDPNSVVREGEYATVQKYAQSWAQTFGFNAARVFSNVAFLTPQARANMKATILAKFKAGQGQYQNLRQSYGQKINRVTQGADGEDYLTDYGGAFPGDGPSGGVPPQQQPIPGIRGGMAESKDGGKTWVRVK